MADGLAYQTTNVYILKINNRFQISQDRPGPLNISVWETQVTQPLSYEVSKKNSHSISCLSNPVWHSLFLSHSRIDNHTPPTKLSHKSRHKAKFFQRSLPRRNSRSVSHYPRVFFHCSFLRKQKNLWCVCENEEKKRWMLLVLTKKRSELSNYSSGRYILWYFAAGILKW